MNAAPSAATAHAAAAASTTTTLLDLVTALGEAGATDGEVVLAVADLLETGRARLIGRRRGSHRHPR